MKTVTYSISVDDAMTYGLLRNRLMGDYLASYRKNPEWYGGADINKLKEQWLLLATNKALFNQLVRDGLVEIKKEPDEYYEFADHCGDMFNPDVNPDIDPKQLKKEKDKERRRFNNEGVFFIQLVVLGEDVDDCSIGGFVGDDFHGSDYDHEFYSNALDVIKNKMPEYWSALNDL